MAGAVRSITPSAADIRVWGMAAPRSLKGRSTMYTTASAAKTVIAIAAML